MEEADRIRREHSRLGLEVWEFKTYDRFLREHRFARFDGAIVYGNYHHVVFGGGKHPSLSSLGIRWINTSNRWYYPTVPKVTQDDLEIGRLAGRFLRSKGFQHFAFFGFPQNFLYSEERRIGFIQGLGIQPEELWDLPKFTLEGQLEKSCMEVDDLREMVAKLPTRGAIFAGNDEKAVNLLPVLESHGRRVPQDIVVLGVDDDPMFTKRGGTGISSIDPNAVGVGMRAMRVMFDWLISGQDPPLVTLVNSPTIKERMSTDQTAVADPEVHRLLTILREAQSQDMSVEEMAKLIRLTPRTFVRRFQIATGNTPTQYQMKLKLERACQLLSVSDHPVAHIAELAGFHDLKWFYRAFNKHTGESPRKFRQRLQS